jgi:hypothetical protein
MKRDTFKILHISQEIVKRINEIAISQKQSKSPHLEVLQGNDQTQVADDDDAIPEVEQSPLLPQRVIHHIIPPNDEIETTLHDIHDDDDDESDDSSYQPSDQEDIEWVGDFEENDDKTGVGEDDLKERVEGSEKRRNFLRTPQESNLVKDLSETEV